MHDGSAMLLFAIRFSAFRWTNDLFRATPSSYAAPPNFYPILYAAVLMGCAGMLVWRECRRNKKIPGTNPRKG
jgi:hypothetical protein